MEAVSAKFPVLAALGGRRSSPFREVAAGAVLVVIWAVLWAWLLLGVAVPASATARRLSTAGAPAAELALWNAGPSLRAP